MLPFKGKTGNNLTQDRKIQWLAFMYPSSNIGPNDKKNELRLRHLIQCIDGRGNLYCQS